MLLTKVTNETDSFQTFETKCILYLERHFKCSFRRLNKKNPSVLFVIFYERNKYIFLTFRVNKCQKLEFAWKYLFTFYFVVVIFNARGSI